MQAVTFSQLKRNIKKYFYKLPANRDIFGVAGSRVDEAIVVM